MKKTPEKYWNFRIGVSLFKYDRSIYKDEKLHPDTLLYSIIEVHYENGIPIAYGKKDLLSNMENKCDLILIHKYIKEAFSKPVLDLDNFPNEIKE